MFSFAMKTRRSVRKLLLPLIALGMMVATMYYDGSHHAPVSHDLRTR